MLFTDKGQPTDRRSIIGVVSPLMLSTIPNGGTYFFFAAFAVLGFLTTCEWCLASSSLRFV